MAGRSLLSRTAVCCIVAVAVALAVAVAGCGSAPVRHATAGSSAPASRRLASAAPAAAATTTIPSLPAGQQGTQQQVPWPQVGPGWFLAEWQQAVSQAAPTSLFLVDPAGGRYLIDTFPANPAGSTPYLLAGWSGDGQRALLRSAASATVGVLNLRTLALTKFGLGAGTAPLGFTAPDGLAIMANGSPGSGQMLERFSLTGHLELSYPTTFPGGGSYEGSALYSADGTELAVGTSTGVELLSNGGQDLSFLPVSSSVGYCTPHRWWTAAVLLVGCVPNGSGIPQLWLVPTSGATPTALTANPPTAGDEGELDAWQLPSGTYVQDAGACGYVYVAKLASDGRTAPVAVPSVPSGDSTVILGAQGNGLAIDAVPACRAGATLMWYAPATNSVIPLLGGAASGGGTAESIFMFGEPWAA
jgi:hypothetical protein